MPKLVSVDVFRAAIGEMNIADINVLLGSAMDLVTAPLESFLHTRFSYGTFSDHFYEPPIDPVVTVQPYGWCCPLGLLIQTRISKFTHQMIFQQ